MSGHPWSLTCDCPACAIIGALVLREAQASVRLSHDEDMQTFTLDGSSG